MAIFSRRKDDGTTTLDPDASGVSARDSDLAVPPFRPVPKELPPVSLSPKPAPANASLRPSSLGMPARPGPVLPRGDAGERRTLVVGRGISLQGTVADAERLEVEGTVESQMIQAAELLVANSGVFKGEVEVDDAEIAGLFDGTLTARVSLTIRASGRVNGVARCRRLSVEEGGQVSGRMEMLTEQGGGLGHSPSFGAPALPLAAPERVES